MHNRNMLELVLLSLAVFALNLMPSNVLFLAYGLTGSPLVWLAAPFFIGRLATYTLAVMGGAYAAQHLQSQLSGTVSGLYFVITQALLLGLVYLFARINWRQALGQRWLRWMS